MNCSELVQRISISRRSMGFTGLALLVALQLTGVACKPFGATPDCGMGDVAARGSATMHVYSFSLDCKEIITRDNVDLGNVKGNINASFDETTGVAQESFRNEKGRFIAEWNCPRDPWTRIPGDDFTCKSVSKLATLSVPDSVVQSIYDAAGKRPYSADILTDGHRSVLEAQRQNFLKASAPQPAPAPAKPPRVIKTTGKAKTTVDRSSAEYVKWLQGALNLVNRAEIPVDGDFGPVTDRAVRDFQAGHGLVVDGIVGPVTEQALVAAGSANPPGFTRTGEAKQTHG